jgi:adenine/guanine phosphoribosyltransferase-like PRPP-binding protein
MSDMITLTIDGKSVQAKDITTLLANPEAFNHSIDLLSELVSDADKIIGLDAR